MDSSEILVTDVRCIEWRKEKQKVMARAQLISSSACEISMTG
ncbi:hypothetical protein [Chryseobacterium profundimaris]|nr:hypothetical protein [Chryseobacterium profundimaris]